jgi:hypothetical protein
MHRFPSIDAIRALVEVILRRADAYSWRAHGFGVIQAYLGDEFRLHVWDSARRKPGVSMIHDHTQWHFSSLVLAGSIRNIRYAERAGGKAYMMATIQTGPDGAIIDTPRRVELVVSSIQTLKPGAIYSQTNREFHESDPVDGTVTLIHRVRTADGDIARVCWPEGEQWGDARPRPATADEVRSACMKALNALCASGKNCSSDLKL